MRFRVKTKNAPENNSKAKPPSRLRPFRLGISVLAGFFVIGFGVAAVDIVTTIPQKRPVLQCKHDVKEEPIMMEKELTAEQARHLIPPKKCEKKLCNWKMEGMTRKKFYNCEPLTEKKLSRIEGEQRKIKKKAKYFTTFSLGGLIALVIMAAVITVSILRNKPPANQDNQNVS